MADHKRTIAAEQFDDKRPELWSVAVKSKWNPRFRDWIWVSSMLWVACGVVITSYIFYSTTAPYESADVMGTGIIGISAGPAAVQIAAVLASEVWAPISIPVAMGGLIRLSRHQRNNWLRSFAWICACVAGAGLLALAFAWGHSSRVSWAELPLCFAWLVLGFSMSRILTGRSWPRRLENEDSVRSADNSEARTRSSRHA